MNVKDRACNRSADEVDQAMRGGTTQPVLGEGLRAQVAMFAAGASVRGDGRSLGGRHRPGAEQTQCLIGAWLGQP